MLETNAKLLLQKYGMPEERSFLFINHSDDIAKFLIEQHADFSYITGTPDGPKQLQKLADALKRDPAPDFARGKTLISVKNLTGRGSLDFSENNVFFKNPAVSLSLAGIVTTWNHTDLTELTRFVQARARVRKTQDSAKVLADVLPVATQPGLSSHDILHAMKRITSAGDDCTPNLQPANLPGVIRVNKAFPLDQKFTGFTRWGPGDAVDKSTATNLRNHFEKHICDSLGECAMEARWWWQVLQIRVRVTDLENPDASPAERGFFRGDGTLDPTHISDFIQQVVKHPDRQDLRDKIRAAYESAYSEYALRLSRELSDVLVEAGSENKVMISGYSGHLAIFGRHDDANDPSSELGVSTCYFVKAENRKKKLTLEKSTKLWNLS